MGAHYRHLSSEERCRIEALRKTGNSVSALARQLGRPRERVSRELSRNSSPQGCDCRAADRKARERRREASAAPRQMKPEICAQVREMLQRQCSPEHIAGRLRLEGVVTVPCWWINRWIDRDRAASGHLYLHLRGRTAGQAGAGCIPGGVDLSERPPEAEGKGRVGSWEVDTVVGGA